MAFIPRNGTTSNKKIIQYTLAFLLFWVSLYLYYPTLSVYVDSKTHDLVQVGTVLAMYGLWQMIIRIPLGVLSDWVNKQKPLMIIGFVLAAVGAFIMAKAGGFWGLILGRSITSASASFWVILVVVFSRLYPPQEAVKATAILSMINAFGRMMGTALTGWLNDIGGYELSFYAACIAAFLAVLVILPGKEGEGTYLTPSFKVMKELLSNPSLMVPSWLSVLTQYVVFATTFGFIPILAANLSASNILQSLLMSMNLLIIVVGNILVTRLANRFSTANMIAVSFLVLTLGLILAGLAHTLSMIFIAQALIGIGNGINYPALMGLSIQSIEDRQRSTAMGIHQSIYAIGMFVGPWLSGIIADYTSISRMFLITAGCCLIISIVGVRRLRNI
jgi:MFS family permease